MNQKKKRTVWNDVLPDVMTPPVPAILEQYQSGGAGL